MIIHSDHQIKKERIERKKMKGKQWWRVLLVISLTINILVVSGAIIGGGLAIKKAIKKGKFEESFDKAFGKFKRQFIGVVFYTKSIFVSDIPHIEIDIKFKNYKKLMDLIAEAKKIGILFASNDDFVPGKIRYEDQSIPVELRLKGVNIDQFETNKFGLRIKTKGGYAFRGMRLFSIHDPEQRSYMYEWGALTNLRLEGILAPRYEFIDVSINGKRMGIYALEENFSKELLESQGRREGIILKFNSDPFWRQMNSWIYDPKAPERSRAPHYPEFFILQPTNWLNLDIDAFQSTRVAKSKILSVQRDAALGLFEEFRTGKKKASEVFDAQILARYLAIAHLWGGEHGVSWRNIRFYYNPITNKIEPIGYDLMCGIWDEYAEKNAKGEMSMIFPWGDFDWVALALQDKTLAELYVKEALRISSPGYLTDLKQKINKDLEKQARILWREKPETIDWGKLEHNRNLYWNVLYPFETIRAYLNPSVIKDEATNSYFVEITVENLLTLPVEIFGFKIDKGQLINLSEKMLSLTPAIPNRSSLNKYILDGVNPLEGERAYQFYVPIDSQLVNEGEISLNTKVQVASRLLGNPNDYLTECLFMPKPKFIEGIPHAPQIEELLKQHPFLEYSNERSELYIQKGSWEVKGDLVVPKNIKLAADAGTTLKFEPKAVLVADDAPLIFKGTDDDPVRLCAQNGNWSGLIVLNSKEESLLENVVIEDTSGIERGGWVLTSGVTFYNTSVNFDRIKIQNNHCEDALNLVHTEYTLTNSLFKNTFSDAIDNDFCNGTIESTVFVDIKADAIDVSTTKAKIKNVKVFNAGDKGLSIGEKSVVYAEDVFVDKADFGAASKDLSEIEINNMTINQTIFGLAAYQKKPEYGPAKIKANNIKFNQVKKEILCQNGSSIVVNGKEHPVEEVDIDKLYEKWKKAN